MTPPQRENCLVRDSCAEHLEPALEPCMKIQRIFGVNGFMREQQPLLIRVVPPKDIRPRSLCESRETGVFRLFIRNME